MVSKVRKVRKCKQQWYKDKNDNVRQNTVSINHLHLEASSTTAAINITSNEQDVANSQQARLRKSRVYFSNPEVKRVKMRKHYASNREAKRIKKRKEYESNPEAKRLKEREKYASNPDPKRERERQEYASNSDVKRLNKRKEFASNPDTKRLKEREKYALNPDPKRSREREEYANNREDKRLKKRNEYIVNPEPKRLKTKNNYYSNPETKQKKEKQRYAAVCKIKRKIRRKRYITNPISEKPQEQDSYSPNRGKAGTSTSGQTSFKVIVNRSGISRRPKSFFTKLLKRYRDRRWRRKCKKGSFFSLKWLNIETCARNLAAKMFDKGSFTTKLMKAKSVLKWCVYAHKTYREDFSKVYRALQSQCLNILNNASAARTEIEEVEALCGKSLHSNTSEPFLWEFSYKVFRGPIIAIDQNHQAVNIFNFHRFTKNKKGNKRHEWKCNNEICDIQAKVITVQLKPLFDFISKCSLKQAFNFALKLSSCSIERSGYKHVHSLPCYSGSCVSKLPYLRTLSPHFPQIRTCISKLYKMKVFAKKMQSVKRGIDDKNIHILKTISSHTEKNIKTYINDNEKADNTLVESEILTSNQNAFRAFEKRCLGTPIIPCVSCEKLLIKRQVSLLKNLRNSIKGNVWNKLTKLKPTETRNGHICRGCLNKIRKDEMPSTCILNGLKVSVQPQQILSLNNFEKILIQRAKAFQVVSKMSPVSKKLVPANQKIQKVIGSTFHLPLPLEETLQRLPKPTEPLNTNHELYILVRGLATKLKRVWEMMVDINKVYDALKFLKINNRLYKEIKLPCNPETLLNKLKFIECHSVSENKLNNEHTSHRRGLLTQVSPTDWEAESIQYTIHALHESKSSECATKLYKMLKVVEAPLDHRNDNIDLLCFPDLFCNGKFGQFHSRETKLTSAEFVKSRLLSKHSQFRLNQQYLFYLLHDANIRQLKQGIFHKLNVTTFNKTLTAEECIRSIESGQLERDLTSIFSKLRNTSQFWTQPRNDVNCMSYHYGPATWFLTISPSEWNWDDLAHYIRQVNQSMIDVNEKSTSELVALDPVSASRFIDIKFHAMLDFIMSDDAPLGKISHYFYRREYQSRGLQHFHLLLWVENTPVLGKSTNTEVSEFVTRYVTCQLPKKSFCPTLFERVTKYQSHVHNSYCMRNKKTKNGFRKVCRFGFPRPASESFLLRDVVEAIAGRKTLRSKNRLYDLPRTLQERNINDYNPAVLLAWDGNVDIQYIGEKSTILNWYVTKYTTKSEQSHVEDVFKEINSTKSICSRLFNIGMRALNNRECGALETSDTLLGIPLYGTDPNTSIRWVDVNMIRRKRLQSMDKIKLMNKKSTDLFFESWVDDYYPKRPAELEKENLHYYVQWFDLKDEPLKGEREMYKMYNNKYLVRRKHPYIINHYRYSLYQTPEKYYYALLLLFMPWRSTEDIKGKFNTYEESFIFHRSSLFEAVAYDKKLQELQVAFERTKDLIKEKRDIFEKEDCSEGKENVDGMNIAFQLADADITMQNLKKMTYKNDHLLKDTVLSREKCQDSVHKLCNQLNSDQRRVFDYVKEVVSNTNGKNAVLRHFVSGVGGTGKSYLINTIKHWTTESMQKTTAVAAPTGLSAYNVNGHTIFKLFQLPVEHGHTPKFRALSDDTIKVLRNGLNEVILFIIDEISMVSNLTLMYIHLRLCEIFNTSDVNDGWFGKKHILLFGDLLQLPPVHEDSPFIELSTDKLKNYVGSISSINIWYELFTFDELTINMRQFDDKCYADLLSRVRIGEAHPRDISLLNTRKIPLNSLSIGERLKELGNYIADLSPETVCLCSTGHQCSELNSEMLSRIAGDIVYLEAKDSVDCESYVKNKVNKLIEKYDTDCTRTAGIEKIITVKIGAKVMLRRNIDVTIGLVNSAIGIIHGIKRNVDNPKQVDSVKIQFENGVMHNLERVKTKFEILEKAFVYREQFPITVSYGVTIHKCQGLSLKTAVMDIGETIFTCGQTYVALSRVTSLQGLHLINFNPSNIKSQKSAVLEYNRLRSKFRPDLHQLTIICTPTKSKTYVKDRAWCSSKFVEIVQQSIVKNTPCPTSNILRKGKSSTTAMSIHGFSNDDQVSCYANAVIQMLYSSFIIRSVIRNDPLITTVLKTNLYQYENMKSGDSISTLAIRRYSNDPTYFANEQQDCALFFMDILVNNESLKKLVSYCLRSTTQCGNCNYVSSAHEQEENILRVPMNISKASLEDQVRLAVHDHWEFLDDFKCESCNKIGKARCKSEISTTKQHILLQFMIFDNNQNKITSTKLNGIPRARLRIDGKIYKPLSAIFHNGLTINEGHYIAYVRSDSNWYCVSDTYVWQSRWPPGSKNLYMLLMIKE